MTAFSYYGVTDDISGVTSWLGGLLGGLREGNEAVSLRLHHFGMKPREGTLYQVARGCGVRVSGTRFPTTTRLGFIDILEFLNLEQPEVFLPQALPAPHFAARLAGFHGLPWVFTLHSDDPEYWALAELAAPDRSHGVWVAVSEALARESRQRFPHADVRMIPYGVDIPEDNTGWNSEKFRIVYLGRMVEEQKRISMVMEVFLNACAKSPRIEAVFIGDGAGRKHLEEQVRQEALGDRLRFTGRLDAEGVRRELLEAQAIVLMSDYEGLPVALLEAMACGVVPVVRNIRSGIPEVVRHQETGLLVEDDPSEAAEAIATLAEDEAGWQAMSAACRALVIGNYSHETCLAKWLGLIEEMKGRATVHYPLPVPMFPKLPPYDERLRACDHRSPLWMRKVGRKLARLRDIAS
jgi:glycosyltransferase involved in cell wall biosynthesis